MAAKQTAIVRRSQEERNIYVNNNLRLVTLVAGKFFRNPNDPGINKHFGQWGDLIQEGFLALMRAADTYDESNPVPFVNYACICIARAFKKKVQKKRDILRDAKRLNNLVGTYELEEIDILEDKSISFEAGGDMKFLLSMLPKKSRDLLNDRFWLKCSIVEMANSRGVTPTSVKRALDKTIVRLKEIVEEL